MGKIQVMEHPLIQHKIGIIRRTETSSKEFRELVSEIAMFMAYEATRGLKLRDIEIDTPITKTTVKDNGQRTGRQETGSSSHSPCRTGHGGRYAHHDSRCQGGPYWSVP